MDLNSMYYNNNLETRALFALDVLQKWGSLYKRSPILLKWLILCYIQIVFHAVFANNDLSFAILEQFFDAKFFILRNYSYICSEMGISYKENPKTEKEFGGLFKPHFSEK